MDFKSGLEILGFLITIIALAVTLKNKVENLESRVLEDRLNKEKTNIEQWAIITKIREWITDHEKNSSQTRLDIEKEFGKIREEASKNGAKMDTVMNMLTELAKKFDKLEMKLDQRDN